MRLEDIDLTKLASFGGDMPDHWFTFLRREAPVWYHPPVADAPELGGDGFWVLSKYEDIVPVNRDWQTFSAEKRPGHEGGGGITITDGGGGAVMITTDPPRQVRLRQLVNKGFSPRKVRRLEAWTRDLARRLFDVAVERGECDFVTEIAAQLPIQVIAEILGVPEADREQVFTWTNQSLDATISDRERGLANLSINEYACQLGEEKRARPTDDILSAIVHAEITEDDGSRHKLSDAEIGSFFNLIAIGGSETTRNAISGALLAFIEHPDQLEIFRSDRSTISRGVEEILRWTSPVNYFRRSAMRDVEIRGQKIQAGEKVTFWYCSANRDEDVFEDPFRLDVTRWPNYPLTFGAGGPHYCLGANLAKMEIEIVYDELVRRITDVEVTGPVERFYTRWDINVFGGYKALPIRFRSL